MRSPLAALTLVLATSAFASDVIVQNDHFTSGGSVNASISFGEYEGAGVLLYLDAGATLKAIDVLCVPGPGGNTGDIGSYLLDVWDEGTDAGLRPPGEFYGNRVSSSTAGYSLTAHAGSFNRITLPSPVVMKPGFFFVSVKEQYQTSFDGTTIALDLGPTVPGANWYSSINFYSMPDAGTFVTPEGNWIIRAVFAGPADDAGVPDSGTGGGTGGGSGGGTGGSTGSGGGTGGGATGGSTGGGTGGSGGSSGLALDSVDPKDAYAGEDTSLTLLGSGFQSGAVVLVGTKVLETVTFKNAAVMTAVVPKGFAVGTYDVSVVNPDGAKATLAQALQVYTGVRVKSGCGCTGIEAAPLAGLAFLALVRRRRRTHCER